MTFALLCLLAHPAAAESVSEAFPPPAGAARVTGGAFGDWLAARPLREADEPVRTYAGQVVGHRARVVDLPLVKGDLQQCADSAIRLRAEWLREVGAADIAFHATSGDLIPWSRVRDGERPYVDGRHLAWRSGAAGSWDAWLTAVFTWAGTRSLAAYDTVAAAAPQPGDVVVTPGSPGHAVLLLDVATRGTDTFVLVGEGYMPAQDFHVELGPEAGWWAWTEDGLDLPHWSLPADGLRRWSLQP